MKSSPMSEIPYTVRLAPKLLELIEKTAQERGIAPRKLIRAVLAEHFGGDGRPRLGGPIAESNQHPSLDQILFDLTAPGSRSSICSITRLAPRLPTRSARLRNKRPSATWSGSG